MSNVIAISNLTKDYGNGKGVFDVSFSVKEGEVFGYLGPNGAGKTTTIRQLMGFIRPQKGECRILGMDCFTEASLIQKEVGYLAGELAFMDDMQGRKFLEFLAELKGIKDLSRMEELIERFELNPQGRMRKMSKGMKQKIGIISAFMGSPKVAVLDEPTSGLDPLMQNRFVELILEEKKKGTTILMSSHIFEEVEKTCDRTAIIRAGRIVAVEDMKSLSQKRKKIYTVTFAEEETAARFERESGLRIKERAGSRVLLTVKNELPKTLQKIAEYNPVDLDVKTQSLEELFMHFYGEEEAR